ncbi:sigma-54-dependent transcriptional regulator [Granulosicoccus antarcticus]|uniref:C4-dicarboxylate transport transcriptional regulatory protein DctD n=1 Tax=Granulosicoccus antarcticus IMCC3135 TaxID=1192854 RepID=A0A2Z2NVN4_9GAMM|nr:response regulator [Granulosicoccus antarcticus]ASJ75303.1 C4-dicarboxylate transport transcriptional regulatory protein DctD [Granulosicoccus antarcticus IMCC3135]
MKRILLVEDEEVILKALRRLLERNHFHVETATTVEQAIAAQPQSFDLVLADLRLPGAEGTSVIPLADPVPVIIMTSHASVRSAVDAMRHGAIDYIAKPFDHDELLMVINRALMQNLMQAQNRALRLDVQRTSPLQQHVRGTVLEDMLNSLTDLRDTQRFLHLHGEWGTDREGLARLIHANGCRREAPFVVADIGIDTASSDAIALLGSSGEVPRDGLPPGGLLQAAHNGTLVLRHPEQLQPELQLQLASVLVQGSINLPGTSRQRSINVKIITIAHDSIEQLESDNTLIPELAELFVNDQFSVPPLRLRRDDILPLACQQLRVIERRHGCRRLKLSVDAEASLRANDWPGNVMELDNVITRAVFVTNGNTITSEDLGFSHGATGSRDLSLDEYFRYFVLHNQLTLSETELAARLGISRKALWERRQKMNLLRESAESVSP